MDSRQVDDEEFTVNLVTPDNGEKFVVELSDSTLAYIEGFQADEADLTVTINRASDIWLLRGDAEAKLDRLVKSAGTMRSHLEALGMLDRIQPQCGFASVEVRLAAMRERQPWPTGAYADALARETPADG